MGFIIPANIKYYIFNAGNREVPIHLVLGDKIHKHYIDASAPIKVIIHGINSNGFDSWLLDMKEAYFEKSKVNVISIDWGYYAFIDWNVLAFILSQVTKQLASTMADMMISISNQAGVKLDKFHIIGFAMGAQLAGFIGQKLKPSTPIGRITGLDPAFSGFFPAVAAERLSEDDAKFVDIIHTSGLGYPISVGIVDFYPNGGILQHGCELAGDPCSHIRAIELMSESIRTGGFIAWRCNWHLNLDQCILNGNLKNIMGEDVNQELIGDFYLFTNMTNPYACKLCGRPMI